MASPSRLQSLEEAEQRADIQELKSLLSQATDMVRWGSWTVCAELAEKASVTAKAIRQREKDSAVRQQEFDLEPQRPGTASPVLFRL